MKPTRQTYVTFIFSPAFISESKKHEAFLVADEERMFLKPGLLGRIREQYDEVEVTSRDLGALQVPKGALYFYFFDRLVATVYENKEPFLMYSGGDNFSPTYYLDNEGKLFTRTELETNKEMHEVLPGQRKCLLTLMDIYKSDRIIQAFGLDKDEEDRDDYRNIILTDECIIISPDEVQMVDTEIPWPSK